MKTNITVTPKELLDSKLSSYCAQNDFDKAKELLKEHPDMDITEDEGELFKIIISHNYTELLEVFLGHYIETKLQGDKNSVKYKAAKYLIKTIIRETLDVYEDISPGIREVINKYDIFPTVSVSVENSDIEEFLDTDYALETVDDYEIKPIGEL